MAIVAEVRSLGEALALLRGGDELSNLIVCDPSADTRQEFDAMKAITQEYPAVKIVLLTERMTPSWLDMAIDAGASGFLPKDISAAALRFSLEIILLGEQIFPTLVSLLSGRPQVAAPAPLSAGPERQIPLSTRERQILSCLVNGLPNKTIARNLNMAEATVKVHLKALLRKINAQNRTQAAIWGVNHASGAAQIPQIISQVPNEPTNLVALNSAAE